MIVCSKCGKKMEDDAQFCSACGCPLVSETAAPGMQSPALPATSVVYVHMEIDEKTLAREKACLNKFRRFLKLERLTWLLGGIFGLINVAIILIFLKILAAHSRFDLVSEGLLTLPVAIFDFIMSRRARRCMVRLYVDAKPMIRHCGSVVTIVFAALFNIPALAFILINFVRTKSNAAMLKQIVQRQDAFHRGIYHK